MKDARQVVVAIWLLLSTIGGVLCATAAGWYGYLLLSAATGFLAWTMLSEHQSRKIFLGCVALAAVAGTATHWLFQMPDGSFSNTGRMVLAPVILVSAFFAIKIYEVEAGQDDDP